MNYNGWITDRQPTEEDALGVFVFVWTGYDVQIFEYPLVILGVPWAPIPNPDPYVKSKRWTVDWNHYGNTYVITDGERRIQLHFKECIDAAQRICDIYNEVMP